MAKKQAQAQAQAAEVPAVVVSPSYEGGESLHRRENRLRLPVIPVWRVREAPIRIQGRVLIGLGVKLQVQFGSWYTPATLLDVPAATREAFGAGTSRSFASWGGSHTYTPLTLSPAALSTPERIAVRLGTLDPPLCYLEVDPTLPAEPAPMQVSAHDDDADDDDDDPDDDGGDDD